jgi:hypothetical protein
MFLLRQIKFKGNLTWQSLANSVQIIINSKPLQGVPEIHGKILTTS